MRRPAIDIVAQFPGLRVALIELLGELAPKDWNRPTVCGDWTVHDVALHLLGADVNILSADRDGHHQAPPPALDLSQWDDLVTFIDRRNAVWVEATGRLSPRLTRDLLAETGPQVEAWFRSVDLLAPGNPVAWAGPDPAPLWVHVAREYTERWVHQQHIRDAVGRPGMTDPAFLLPVLDAFALALPHTLRTVQAAGGSVVTLTITGPAGGSWSVVRDDGGWVPTVEVPVASVASLQVDQDTAWRLFTRGISPEAARSSCQTSGNPEIAEMVLRMVSIIV